MGWTYSDNKALPVVKRGGICMIKAKWKYCPYWVAKHTNKTTVIGYRCTLFDGDKEADQSLPECNAQYGMDYDGPP